MLVHIQIHHYELHQDHQESKDRSDSPSRTSRHSYPKQKGQRLLNRADDCDNAQQGFKHLKRKLFVEFIYTD